MKQMIVLFLLVTVFLGCNSVSDQTSGTVKSADITQDTSSNQKKEVEGGNEDELNNIVAEYKEMVNVPYIKDTLLVIDQDTFRMIVKHISISDSPIVVPKKYVEIYKMDSFSTPGFKTSVTIEQSGKMIVQRDISKNDFQQYLHPSLKSYGVLFPPQISCAHDHIEIGHSISIPLTDVGIGVRTIFDKNGKISFKGN